MSNQQTNEDSNGKSKLALAIESRPRKAHDFDVQGFFGLGDKQIHKVAIWVNVKSEQDKAIAAAYQVVSQAAGEHTEAKSDDDLLTDAKTTQILFHACRRCEEEDPELNYRYPAFPSPEWMRRNLTTDQLAVLLNLYHEVRRREAPVPWEIDHDQVLGIAMVSADHSDTALPDTLLAAQSKEWITQAFVILSQMYKESIDARVSANEHEDIESDAPEAPENT